MSRRLAAASSARGPCEMGAATEPLDGRAFTVVVDERAGEGAGNSAASLHRSTWCFSPLFLRFSGGLSGGVGEKVKKRRRLAAFWTGRSSAPLPARQPAAGKMKAAAAGPAGLRFRQEGGNESLGFPGCSGLIYTTDSGGLFFSRSSGDRRPRCKGSRAGLD
jgi:hypothetical protein